MSEKVKACELCEEQPASLLCSECCKCYCCRCGEMIHKLSKKKGHKIEPIPEGVRVDAMCPLHKNGTLEMFCIDEVKLCCSECKIDGLHKDHKIVKIAEVSKDNEIFSASKVRKRFASSLRHDDELDKKIEAAIESIKKEGQDAKEKIVQTFLEAHERLTKEEANVLDELEDACNESVKTLQDNLLALSDVREYTNLLNDVDTRIQGKSSRLMELSLVSAMEEQRKKMEELHRTTMTDLKIMWDAEERKMTFTRTLFNGAPIPKNIEFTDIFGIRVTVSWDCDLSEISEGDKSKIKYVMEMKKKDDDDRGWKNTYPGKDQRCRVTGLEMETEYDVRVKCVIGSSQGVWSDVASVKTKEISMDSAILSQEANGDAFKGELSEWCGTNDFELLYRGTRDGFGAGDFHRACDSKGKTIVLIKNTNGHIFGGFASVPWTNPQSKKYTQAPGSFLFTLTNMYGIQPTRFSLQNENNGSAVCHRNTYGPTFGDDIYISSNCNTNSSSYTGFPNIYNDTTGKGMSIFTSNPGSQNFRVQEIEVFKVNV